MKALTSIPESIACRPWSQTVVSIDKLWRIAVSPDAYLVDIRQPDKPIKVLEWKARMHYHPLDAEAKLFGLIRAGKLPEVVPADYFCQCQLYMIVTDLQQCDLVIHGTWGQTVVFELTRDDDWCHAALALMQQLKAAHLARTQLVTDDWYLLAQLNGTTHQRFIDMTSASIKSVSEHRRVVTSEFNSEQWEPFLDGKPSSDWRFEQHPAAGALLPNQAAGANAAADPGSSQAAGSLVQQPPATATHTATRRRAAAGVSATVAAVQQSEADATRAAARGLAYPASVKKALKQAKNKRVLQSLLQIRTTAFLQGTSRNENWHRWLKARLKLSGGVRTYETLLIFVQMAAMMYNKAVLAATANNQHRPAGSKRRKKQHNVTMAQLVDSIKCSMEDASEDAEGLNKIRRTCWHPWMHQELDMQQLHSMGFKPKETGRFAQHFTAADVQLVLSALERLHREEDRINTQDVYHYISHHLTQRRLSNARVKSIIKFLKAQLLASA